MQTTLIMLLSGISDNDYDRLDDILSEKYENTPNNPSDADFAITAIVDSDKVKETVNELERLISAVNITMPTVETILVSADNVDDWKDYFGVRADDDVVEALINDSSEPFLEDPTAIDGYVNENYIGRFTEEEMAEHLAESDPKINDLDDDIRSALDLVKYYHDTMKYDMWNEGEIWFWNR